MTEAILKLVPKAIGPGMDLAAEKPPQNTEFSFGENGRSYLRFCGNSNEDQNMRFIVNQMLRPIGNPPKKVVTLLEGKSAKINWNCPSARMVNVLEVREAIHDVGSTIRSLEQSVAKALESFNTASELATHSKSLSHIEAECKANSEYEAFLIVLKRDRDRLVSLENWIKFGHQVDGKIKIPVPEPAMSGLVIVIKTHETVSQAVISYLRAKFMDARSQTSADPVMRIFGNLPKKRFSEEENGLKPLVPTDTELIVLENFYSLRKKAVEKGTKTFGMAPGVEEIWAALQVCIAWNALSRVPKEKHLELPKNWRGPREGRPTGQASTRKKVDSQQKLIESMMKTFAEAFAGGMSSSSAPKQIEAGPAVPPQPQRISQGDAMKRNTFDVHANRRPLFAQWAKNFAYDEGAVTVIDLLFKGDAAARTFDEFVRDAKLPSLDDAEFKEFKRSAYDWLIDAGRLGLASKRIASGSYNAEYANQMLTSPRFRGVYPVCIHHSTGTLATVAAVCFFHKPSARKEYRVLNFEYEGESENVFQALWTTYDTGWDDLLLGTIDAELASASERDLPVVDFEQDPTQEGWYLLQVQITGFESRLEEEGLTMRDRNFVLHCLAAAEKLRDRDHRSHRPLTERELSDLKESYDLLDPEFLPDAEPPWVEVPKAKHKSPRRVDPESSAKQRKLLMEEFDFETPEQEQRALDRKIQAEYGEGPEGAYGDEWGRRSDISSDSSAFSYVRDERPDMIELHGNTYHRVRAIEGDTTENVVLATIIRNGTVYALETKLLAPTKPIADVVGDLALEIPWVYKAKGKAKAKPPPPPIPPKPKAKEEPSVIEITSPEVEKANQVVKHSSAPQAPSGSSKAERAKAKRDRAKANKAKAQEAKKADAAPQATKPVEYYSSSDDVLKGLKLVPCSTKAVDNCRPQTGEDRNTLWWNTTTQVTDWYKAGKQIAKDLSGEIPELLKRHVTPKVDKDVLSGSNPAKVVNPPFVNEISPEQLKRVRAALKCDESTSSLKDLSDEDRKKIKAERRTPRWAVRAVVVDPANLDKIEKGELTKDNFVSLVKPPVTPKVQVSTNTEVGIGQRWKNLREKYKGVGLFFNPYTPREKEFRKEFDTLRQSAGTDSARNSLPKLKRRTESNGSGTQSGGGQPQNGGLAGLETFVTMAKMFGEIAKAFRP